jgi:hypothetical protein
VTEEQDFWSETAAGDPDVMPGRPGSRAMVSGMGDTDGAGETLASAIEGLVTGGLPGMLRALDTNPDYDPDNGPGIDDPEALRRAEDAVRGVDASEHGLGDQPRVRLIDEDMTPVATQTVMGQYAGLEDVIRALESEGIDCGWDPNDPRDTVGFTPPGVGMGTQKLFAVVVPVSEVGRARQVLYGEPPQGVKYAWPSTGDARPSEEVDAGYGFPHAPSATGPAGTPAPPVPDMPLPHAMPVTGFGTSLSDNETLEDLAEPGANGTGVAVALLGVLAAIGVAVYFILQRG